MTLPFGNGPIPAKIMIVGEAWGAQEEIAGAPFVGASGQELNRMLHEAGIMRSEVYVTNLVNARPQDNYIGHWIAETKKAVTPRHMLLREKYVLPIVGEGYRQLMEEIALVQPNIIVALGNVSMYALTGAWAITKWRGSQLLTNDGIKVIPTIHPAAVLRQWELRAEVVNDLRRVKRHMLYPGPYNNVPKWEFIVRPSFEVTIFKLTDLREQARCMALDNVGPLWLDFDIETRAGHIACAGISWSLTDAICIPLMCAERKEGYWDEAQEAAVIATLRELLCHENVRVRWQNGLYDAQYTYRWWHFIPRHAQDTMIAHHVAFPALRKSLAFQASLYCDHYVYWKDDGKTWVKNMREEDLWRYNCIDCVRTREVGEVTQRVIDEMGLSEVDKFQQKLFHAVLRTMNIGLRVDHKAKGEMALLLIDEIEKRAQFFRNVLGHELNPKSPLQMQKLFYQDFGFRPILKRTQIAGAWVMRPTLDSSSLQELAAREPILLPLVQAIEEYRSLNVFLSTFVNARLDTDGRMRSSYNICGTKTFRFSSSENAFGSGANMENIPKGGEDADSGLSLPNVRLLYIPDQSYTYFDTDLSKADLRIVVWEADETELKSMLAEGRDPYVETAREFYKDPSISKTLPSGAEHPKYRIFKSFAHGTHYLGTARGLAKRLGLTVHEAERTQAWYFGKYPRIQQWQSLFRSGVESTRSVRNAFGYVYRHFGRIDDDSVREMIAWLPQSTVACLINRIYVNIYDAAPWIQVLNQVHDSICGQFPTYRTDEALTIMKRCSQVVIPYDSPLTIPVGIKVSKESWGKCG